MVRDTLCPRWHANIFLARRLLKSLSIKQGVKYDDPESAKGIPAFIQFHGLKVEEILDPLDSFSTFNAIFLISHQPDLS